MIEHLEARRLLSAATYPSDASTFAAQTARQVEALDRGVVAVNKGSGNVYVGWRLLGTDPADVAFNVYRVTNGGAPVKRNSSPITTSTNFNDTGVTLTTSNSWFVRPVINGIEQADSDSF